LTVEPGKPGSARVEDVPEATPAEGDLLVRAVAVGVCGTDKKIVRGDDGWAPCPATSPGVAPRLL